jgi:hypothetical protein
LSECYERIDEWYRMLWRRVGETAAGAPLVKVYIDDIKENNVEFSPKTKELWCYSATTRLHVHPKEILLNTYSEETSVDDAFALSRC